MLKLQETLFFRSHIRKALLAVLFFGGLAYHIWIFARGGVIAGIRTYGYNWYFPFQLKLFVYYFIIILFLSFDYFREIKDAEALDIALVSKDAFKSDLAQFFVMLQWMIFAACIVLGFAVFGYHIADTLTGEIVFYLCRLVFIYIFLNGLAAALLAWFLSRTVRKLLGYICIILFCCFISPYAVTELGLLSMSFQGLHDLYTVFLILPEGIDAWNSYTMFPTNLTIASRSLFWIFLCLLGLTAISKNRHKKWLAPLLALLLIGDSVYMYLPASFYCDDESGSVSDSVLYDQHTYILREDLIGKEAPGFSVEKYEINLRLRRQMTASVSLFPTDKGLSEYNMTLYHLYNIKSVTDEAGRELPYKREGDYLTVYNENAADTLNSICIKYNGALASFYASSDSVNLPGWFAYYPIPGFHLIYEDYAYVPNWLEETTKFDIFVDTPSTVYSDLNRIENNHFAGEGYGATLLGGFVKEVTLDNGVRYIYPYLEPDSSPTAETCREDCEYVMEYYKNSWEKATQKCIICLPTHVYAPIQLHDGLIIGCFNMKSLAENLKETGNINGENTKADMENAIDLFMTMYQYMAEDSPEELDYAFLKEKWNTYLVSCHIEPATDEEFQAFLLAQLGQEEYNRIMETKQN